MERDELRNKFTEVLTVEDQAERSTMLNDMRAEVEKTYTELDNLKAENTKLVEKNNSLTEASVAVAAIAVIGWNSAMLVAVAVNNFFMCVLSC